MVAVIFEVIPHEEGRAEDLSIAASLRDYSLSEREQAPNDSRAAHKEPWPVNHGGRKVSVHR